MKPVKALVLTGYGLNCDYETDYALALAGAQTRMMHINELIGEKVSGQRSTLDDFHILVVGGGFSWADDHGAGVILASKMKSNLGKEVERFIDQGKLIMGICNGFQALINWGLLPGFDGSRKERRFAIVNNDSGNFVDTWVNLKVNHRSPCVFTKGLTQMELPVRHAEGKVYGPAGDVTRLTSNNQIVFQYADQQGNRADNCWPLNPNGSLEDIAGMCDPTGRIFGLMPHPEAFNHFTNHPDWTQKKEALLREGKGLESLRGEGVKIFRNGVEYIKEAM